MKGKKRDREDLRQRRRELGEKEAKELSEQMSFIIREKTGIIKCFISIERLSSLLQTCVTLSVRWTFVGRDRGHHRSLGLKKSRRRERETTYDGGNERNEREKTRNLFALVAKEKEIEGDADRETRSGTRSLPGTLTATTLTLPSEGWRDSICF